MGEKSQTSRYPSNSLLQKGLAIAHVDQGGACNIECL